MDSGDDFSPEAAMTLACLVDNNDAIRESFGVTLSDSVPCFLEKIAMEMETIGGMLDNIACEAPCIVESIGEVNTTLDSLKKAIKE